jgi:molybdopterin/thiamine biosynthesis adenylyltransferase
MPLNLDQLKRYNRNILLKGIGQEGQEKLLGAGVLVIGAGGLGSACLYYLAAAGIGTIGIADPDTVEPTNLNRQIMHSSKDLNRQKTDSAAEKIKAMNPDIHINSNYLYVDADNIKGLISPYDFIIDATDNFPSKYLINDTCVASKKPFSHGSALAYNGQAMTYVPGSACLRCVMPQVPQGESAPTSKQEGILGAAAGHIGTLQAMEAVKFLTGAGELLVNRMLFFDGFKISYKINRINKDTRCICGGGQAGNIIEFASSR